ncbi:hypothetical protein K466DRAFT_375555 [Polyporus arcularius HHB13444]|uniref:Uncharacterized protein n=1 Tax=Polyporus arcularius HHB13444 TaxID=1314778 RepID=A0A5C3NSK3_9APHY|nr:hypothetical protein K466DRAFT_375555 [Polyporus arcularius HHB13444]
MLRMSPLSLCKSTSTLTSIAVGTMATQPYWTSSPSQLIAIALRSRNTNHFMVLHASRGCGREPLRTLGHAPGKHCPLDSLSSRPKLLGGWVYHVCPSFPCHHPTPTTPHHFCTANLPTSPSIPNHLIAKDLEEYSPCLSSPRAQITFALLHTVPPRRRGVQDQRRRSLSLSRHR